jgi:hypothetical protein
MRKMIDPFILHRSSAYPWTYLESLVRGNRRQREYDSIERYVMFIGQPRSGTSLIGSLLNAHPDIWIAQELNALRYVARGYRRNQLYWLLQMRDREFDAHGRQWTGYDYTIPGQWQGRCRKLRVIGDKKAGLSSELLRRRPQLLARLQKLVEVPIQIFHVVRNPFNVITTIHRKRHRTPLELAVSMYFERCETNWALMQDSRLQVMSKRLEDIIAHPRPHLTEMCERLDVQLTAEYLDACQEKLFDKPRESQTAIAWPTHLIDSVYMQMAKYPFLDDYQFSGQSSVRNAA